MTELSPEEFPLPQQSFLEQTFGDAQFRLFQLAGDASSRRYFRVVHNNSSYVLMVWEPFVDDGRYPFLSVHAHFKKCEIAVPEVVAKSPEKGLVLLEDLGDLTLERKFWENQNQLNALPYYRQAIEQLLKIHFQATRLRENCTAFTVEFNVEKLLWELNYGREHLLQKFCQLNLSASENAVLDRVFLSVCERLAAQPKFIAHRDYHSRNIMIKFGQARIIDFQDARLGTVQYDLVSLLKDSYVDLSEANQASLLDDYYLQLQNCSTQHRSREEFQLVYELQSIQRGFKACGSFASFYNMRADKRYLKYLPGTLQRVRRSLELFPEYQEFHQLLSERGVYTRDYELS